MPAEDLAFRIIGDGDIPAVVALWQACGLARPERPPEVEIAFCRESGHGAILLAESAGRIAGTVMVGHEGRRGWLHYVAVDPLRRGLGIGRRLVQEAERWLEERGVPKALLLVRAENEAAVAFYERLGYEVQPRIVLGRTLGAR